MTEQRISQIKELVAKHRSLILSAERHIWKNPETGYREWKTNEYLCGEFKKLGYEPIMAGNIPGFYCDVDTGKPGPKLLIMGELDSLIVATHPEADPETGFLHACGHHAQSATLLGIAAALKEPGMLDGMSGSIRLMAVPAEELIEIGYREELREKGIIKYFGGKVELMYRGMMDGCDLCLLVHTANLDGKYISTDVGTNGCLTKKIEYIGVSSHAGGAPHKGVNALYAATLGLQAANSLRETFEECNYIRFHPIITRGGGAVNAIPNDVVVESYVRGASVEAITGANDKINRALAASAAAIGAEVVLHDRPGYLPLHNSPIMNELSQELVRAAYGEDKLDIDTSWGTGCTDMGDMSAVMPTIQPMCGGACGTGHGSDYGIDDPEVATVISAQFQIMLANELLCDGAKNALRIIKTEKPLFADKSDYFKAIDTIFMDKQAVKYNADGTVTLDYKN